MKPCSLISVTLLVILASIGTTTLGRAASEFSLTKTPISSELGIGQTAKLAQPIAQGVSPLQVKPNLRRCDRCDALYSIASVYIKTGAVDQALATATGIDTKLYPFQREGYARSGQLSQANGVIEQAYMLFQSDELKSHLQAISIQSVLTQLLIDFAEAYAAVAQIETAKQMIEQAEVMARSIPEETTWLADYKSALIASIQAKAQLLVERERQEQLVKIEGMAVFDAAISEAGLYVITGRTFLARQIAQQAEVLAQNLPEETPLHTMSKQFAFAQVARVFADVGEYEQALAIAQTVEDRASRQAFGLDRIREEAQRSATSSTARRSLLLLPVVRPNTLAMKLIAAVDSAEPGQTNEMARQLERALAIAQSTPQGTVKVRELVEIAYWYVQIGQTDKALEVLDQALEATQSIK
jgi:tetratricopeptide (TPR) repeat protein